MQEAPLAVDLFCGLRGGSEAFADRGWRTFGIDNQEKFAPDLCADILELSPQDVLDAAGGKPDFIWASPPCTAFSVASIGTHWGGGFRAYEPKTEFAKLSIELVKHTLFLIEELKPEFFVIENPVGLLRKMGSLDHLTRYTVTYCKYGETRRKPTDIWGGFPESFDPWPQCKRMSPYTTTWIEGTEYVLDRVGNPCHEAARRGARTGTQGMKSAEAAKVPYFLTQSVCDAVEREMEG